MDALWLDTRYAARRLRKHPGVAAAAVLTIGLAIGTATIVFSAVDALILRPPPFRDPASLVHTEYEVPGVSGAFAAVRQPEIVLWREHPELFSAFEGYFLDNFVVHGAGLARTITAVHVTDGLLSMLGVNAALGRVLGPGDGGSASQPPAVLLTHGLWQSAFGGDPNVVGRVVRLDDTTHTVVGVMPPWFRFPFGTTQAWVVSPLTPLVRGQRPTMYRSVARLAPGVTIDQAQARMGVLMTGQTLGGPPGRVPKLYQVGSRQVHERTRQVLWMLLATVGLLVLVATANVVNLLITEGEAQARQQAVCAAMGATFWRLLRARILEAVMLTGAGAVLGLWLARVGVPLFVASAPRELWIVQLNEISVVWRVALAAAALALTCGVLAAVASVTRARLGDLGVLRSGARVQSSARGRWVVVAQIAAVTMLLTGATLLARSYRHMTSTDPGFDVDRLVAFDVEGLGSTRETTPASVQLFARIDEAVRAVPGVAALSSSPDGAPPEPSYDFDIAIEIEGRGVVVADDPALVMTVGHVEPEFFETLGVPIREGRAISPDDRAGNPRVAVINETFARRHWPSGAAVGSRFRIKSNGAPFEWEEWRTVVGVAGDVYGYDPLVDRMPLGVYYAAAQHPSPRNYRSFVVRAASGDPAALVPSLVAALQRVDANMPVPEFATVREMYAEFFAAPRFYALVTAWISGLGLILAVVGVVGLSLVATARRTAEFGVRLALGAVPRHIAVLVVTQAATLVGSGLALGLLGAAFGTRALRGLVAGISPSDPASLLAAAGVLAVVALAGCWWPARRALRVTPAEALRNE